MNEGNFTLIVQYIYKVQKDYMHRIYVPLFDQRYIYQLLDESQSSYLTNDRIYCDSALLLYFRTKVDTNESNNVRIVPIIIRVDLIFLDLLKFYPLK